MALHRPATADARAAKERTALTRAAVEACLQDSRAALRMSFDCLAALSGVVPAGVAQRPGSRTATPAPGAGP